MSWQNIETAEDKAAKLAEQERQAFKANRDQLLATATVTTSSGKVFDADERSITRMAESKGAIRDAVELGLIADVDDYPLAWGLADNETGVLTPITFAELVEACALANQNRAVIWGR
jgi:hypothetical protein